MKDDCSLKKIDKKILHELQNDGRLSYTDLGKKIGLSTSACLERIKRLETTGVIKKYKAVLAPEYLLAELQVFVQVKISRTLPDAFNLFKTEAVNLAEIQGCYLVSGSFDFLLKARVADMESYRNFLNDKILSLPGVQESTSFIVMEEVKDSLDIPITMN